MLGSGGIGTDERRSLYRQLVSNHLEGCDSLLFVPYAAHDHTGYTDRISESLSGGGVTVRGIHEEDDPIAAIGEAEAIYVGGGNTFLLVRELHSRGLVGPIRESVLSGASYLGVSAGSNVACPSMVTTNDMPIVLPESFETMAIVPFQINPHYHPGKILFMVDQELSQHYGESRAQRISELHREVETPVLGMWEGSFVHWDGETGRLTGRATAFRVGEEPVDLHDGCEFGGDLLLI